MCLRELISEDLVAELAARSAFVRKQVQCIGVGGDVGAVQVPVCEGKAWVACVLRSPGQLEAAGTPTLSRFLQVSLLYTAASL